ncbi:MAG: sigma 54-interacting transcriptional regulator [Pyrinomonadaceae bacterium]
MKLLRVLQELEFERVGGTSTIKVNIRLVAATNQDLETAIKQVKFRRDLFYRLNVVSFEMPRLRERIEDIPLLANYFANKYSLRCNRRVSGISPEARLSLATYDWPGNVRELENAIERAVVLGTTEIILAEDLPETVVETESSQPRSSPQKYHAAIAQAKRQIIIAAMNETKGNYAEAAKALGVHPNYLHRLITNFKLRQQFSRHAN